MCFHPCPLCFVFAGLQMPTSACVRELILLRLRLLLLLILSCPPPPGRQAAAALRGACPERRVGQPCLRRARSVHRGVGCVCTEVVACVCVFAYECSLFVICQLDNLASTTPAVSCLLSGTPLFHIPSLPPSRMNTAWHPPLCCVVGFTQAQRGLLLSCHLSYTKYNSAPVSILAPPFCPDSWFCA